MPAERIAQALLSARLRDGYLRHSIRPKELWTMMSLWLLVLLPLMFIWVLIHKLGGLSVVFFPDGQIMPGVSPTQMREEISQAATIASLVVGWNLIIVFASMWWGRKRYAPLQPGLPLACLACAYPLEGEPAEDDGCTVCPECGGAWRHPGRDA